VIAKASWRIVRLGELAEFRNGVNYNKNSFGEGIKVLGVANFQDYLKPKYGELEQINPEGVVTERNILEDGDIVFVRSNGNRELIGRSLLIENPPEKITHSAFTIRVRFARKDVCPRFYPYLFRTRLIRDALTAHGGGTNISNLNQDILGALEVPQPTLAVQQRIASILSAYDDLIENNQRRMQILNETVRTLYREWFIDFRFPGHIPGRHIRSRRGEIPAGWLVGSLNELHPNERSVVLTGPFGSNLHASDYRDIGVPLLLVKHVREGQIVEDDIPLVEEHKASELAKYRLRVGDIVMTRVGYVGESAFIFERYDGWLFSGQTLRIRLPNPSQLDSRFFAQYLQMEGKSRIEKIAVGATRASLNTQLIASLDVTIPPLELQRRYSAMVKPLDALRLNLLEQTHNLRGTRDLLLPRLLAGQSSVLLCS
jgi:type I restriction enzyme S subunit